jgi:hypothetical protein
VPHAADTRPRVLRCGDDRYGGGREKEDPMGFVKTLVKGAVVAKLLQVAQRELSKPENQRKAKEMFQKVQQRRNAH